MHEPRDLTGNVKIATANADKGLGTGANDYGVAVVIYRAFGATTLFGGVGYTKLGTTRYIAVNAVANANARQLEGRRGHGRRDVRLPAGGLERQRSAQ